MPPTPNPVAEYGSDPAQLVQDYLAAMERRDLETAKTYLAPQFEMIFPGGVTHRSLEALVGASSSRYQRVGKHYERFDVCESGEQTVVYCFGTLRGSWTDGTPFDGIRFIDRFTVETGLLVDQKVWNDIGEFQLANRSD